MLSPQTTSRLPSGVPPEKAASVLSDRGAALRRLWRHPVYRRNFYQAAIVLGLLWLIYAAVLNALANLRARGITLGFGFLGSEAGIPLSGAPPVPREPWYAAALVAVIVLFAAARLVPRSSDLRQRYEHLYNWITLGAFVTAIVVLASMIEWTRYQPADSYLTIVITGMVNNIRVGLVAAVLAVALGFVLGICLRSSNWLLRNLVAGATELSRNVPILLHVMFWYSAILVLFPVVRRAIDLGGIVFLSQRGIYFPTIAAIDTAAVAWLAAMLAAAFVAIVYKRLSKKWLYAAIPPALLFLGMTATWDIPRLRGFNFTGGAALSPEYAALLFGLTLYVSAFIAEIVRSGIAAIPKGQWEAAASLGLPRLAVITRVIIPQALRVIVPPLSNQLLGLAKNTSLGVAIAYPELVSVTRTIVNQTGQAFEIMAILTGFFLAINVLITTSFNSLNRKLKVVER